ncbi:MAG: DEAD/DEAH box helicase [Desulfomonilaceae bacterium]
MNTNPFYRLAPFIQEYIYNHGWTEMRSVQVEACRVIFDTDAHLLLSSGTASGKTEAAFLPILTLLHEAPPTTIGALYIGPLKALINDQFVRLQALLKEAEIPVWHWHGDVSQGHKNKLLANPRGVLQITPESMESLLINKTPVLGRMFWDLRFIVIDEIHAFMGSDRGRQVLCQLERLSKFVRDSPRRIGLSATLGDYAQAEDWLGSGTDQMVITPKVGSSPERIRIAVETFCDDVEEFSEKDKTVKENASDRDNLSEKFISGTMTLDEYVFDHTLGKKCLIFANSRGQTESIVSSMRQIAENRGVPDIYHVHHGSISAPLREAAENAMRDLVRPAVTAATVTLELGIDIGQLERIMQIGTPHSVSSFVQRLGRSGRRNNPAEMWFVFSHSAPGDKTTLPEQVPWDLLQAIAIIQLYLEERWIEPIPQLRCPFSLLYHQTMSILASVGELSPQALASRVLTLSIFRQISAQEFRELLLHLIDIEHVQKTDEGGLIVGLEGEKVVRNFRFYAVFPDNEEFTVKEKSTEIGSIVMPPPPGERFGLAGRAWEVSEIDVKRKVVFATRVKGKVPAGWHGGGGEIHTKIVRRVRQILFEDIDYAYLQSQARNRLAEIRWLARNARLEKETIVSLGGDTYCIFPWIGTVGYRTLERSLSLVNFEPLDLKMKGGFSPYFLKVDMRKGRPEDIVQGIISLRQENLSSDSLVRIDEGPHIQKYDEFIPPNLLRKAFCTDYFDMTELDNFIENTTTPNT